MRIASVPIFTYPGTSGIRPAALAALWNYLPCKQPNTEKESFCCDIHAPASHHDNDGHLITPLTSCTIRSCGVGTRPVANSPANCRHEARTDPTCHATGCSLQAGCRASAPGSGGRPCPSQMNMCVPWSRTAAVSARTEPQSLNRCVVMQARLRVPDSLFRRASQHAQGSQSRSPCPLPSCAVQIMAICKRFCRFLTEPICLSSLYLPSSYGLLLWWRA